MASPAYEAVRVLEPSSVGVYVTEQRPLSSVQLVPSRKSPLPLKLTVPVAVVAPAPEESVTVAVHVVATFSATLFGEQLTLVVVDRMVAVTGALPVLAR